MADRSANLVHHRNTPYYENHEGFHGEVYIPFRRVVEC